jgi:hypothetical protein
MIIFIIAGLPSPSDLSQTLGNILQLEDNESYSSSRAESTSTRIRTRRNKRTQDIAELDGNLVYH